MPRLNEKYGLRLAWHRDTGSVSAALLLNDTRAIFLEYEYQGNKLEAVSTTASFAASLIPSDRNETFPVIELFSSSEALYPILAARMPKPPEWYKFFRPPDQLCSDLAALISQVEEFAQELLV